MNIPPGMQGAEKRDFTEMIETFEEVLSNLETVRGKVYMTAVKAFYNANSLDMALGSGGLVRIEMGNIMSAFGWTDEQINEALADGNRLFQRNIDLLKKHHGPSPTP